VKRKIVTAAQAIALIRDGDTVACSGFVGSGTPEELFVALERRFLESGTPRNLTLVFAAAPGDGRGAGLDRLAHPGLVGRAIGGHWGLVPRLAERAVRSHIEAWNLPLGTLSQLFRDIAGHRAGSLTKVGLHTFVDPRQEGGRINARTSEDLVRVMTIDGEEWLFYKSFPVTVALIRATTSDPAGNLTMEREALTLDTLAIAMAARNSGGLVIAQVERIAAPGSLNARQVQVPGVLVDCVVVAEPQHHGQTFGTSYNAAYSAEIRLPADMLGELPLDARKVIARRCAFDLPMGGVVNLGIGMPEGVATVAHEERVLDHVTLTAEPGIVGGVPQSGLDFGAAVNADAVIAQASQFDYYDGGGLDMACLGMAQVDGQGNVNVSRFGDRLAGAGGFINISQNARRVVFAGTFTTGGLDVRVGDGKLAIVREGTARKFVARVDQVTFNGAHAAQCGREVVYVTERCVFRRTAQGVELTEVAPGVDIERDILAQMDFVPIVREPRPMDPRIFRDEAMHLDDDLLGLGLAERISVDEGRDILFLNLEGMHVRTRDDVDRVRRAVEDRCRSLGRKVALVVNYDGFSIDAAVADTYAAMVRTMEADYYTTATRYTTSAFLRMKLGEALARRRVAPHIFETAEEAQAFIEAGRGDAER
jgi:propionate CoA-transferase